MTPTYERVGLIALWSDHAFIHDGAWACLHIARKLFCTPKLILRAELCAFKIYQVTRLHRPDRVTMITLDMTQFLRMGILLNKTEKLISLCPACLAHLMREARAAQISSIPRYASIRA